MHLPYCIVICRLLMRLQLIEHFIKNNTFKAVFFAINQIHYGFYTLLQY